MNMKSKHYQDYAVHMYKSEKLVDEFWERYNVDKPNREKLKTKHSVLTMYILKLYKKMLEDRQAYIGNLKPGQRFPTLHTNNKQLSKKLKCDERTIIRIRARLKAAGVIKSEKWHGTNAQYEIELNPQVLHLQFQGKPENAIQKFQPGYQTANEIQEQPAAAPNYVMATKSRHTATITKLKTNKLIELSGANYQHSADIQSVKPDPSVSECGKHVDNREKSVDNPQLKGEPEPKEPKTEIAGSEKAKRAQETTENPPSCGAPPIDESKSYLKVVPEFAPDTVAEALAGLPEEQIRKIRGHLTMIWTCANLNLYDDKWINEAETERGLARLAEYFCYSHAKGWPGGAAEIIERIMLVRRWIQGGDKAGQKRWVPLPSHYFDIRNDHGFRATKKWFKDHMRSKREIKNSELLTKAIKEYTRSFDPEAKYGPSEAYRRISQRLGKRDRSLLEKFHQQIDDYAKSRSTEPETKA